MPDPKYKTPNGKIVSEKDLKEKYGTKFDSLVNANTFSLINENVYKTPNGTFEIESVLEKKYGDRFAQLVVDKTFELEDQIKKKEGFIGPDLASDMEQNLPIPPTQDGSLATSEPNTQNPKPTPEERVSDLDYKQAILNQLQDNLAERDTTFTNIANYERATSVRPEDAQQIERDAQEKLEGSTFEKFTQGAVNVLSKIGAVATLGLGPDIKFSSYKERKQEKAIKFLEEQDKEQTPENLDAAIKEITIKDETDALKERRTIDYIGSLPEKEREELNVNQVFNYKTVEMEEKAAVIDLEIDFEKLTRAASRVNSNEDFIRRMNEEGKELPEGFNERYAQNFELRSQIVTTLDDKYKKFEEKLEQNQDKKIETTEAIDLIKRNYGFVDNMKAQIAMSIGDLVVAGSQGAFAYALNIKAAITGNESDQIASDEMAMSAEETKKMTQEVAQNFRPRMEYDNITGLQDVGYFMAQETATQGPILAAIMNPFSATAGITALGISTGGSKFSEMKSEESGINPANYSLLQEISIPFGYGAAESVFGALPTSRILRRSVSSSANRALLNKGALGFTKQFFKDNGVEVLTENATTFSQNLLDRFALDKKDVLLTDNLDKTTFSTLASSPLIIGGGKITGELIKPFMPKSQIEEIKNGYLKVIKLQKAFNNAGNQSTRNILEGKIKEANASNDKLINKARSSTSNLSQAVYNKVNGITKNQALLQAEAKLINEDKALSQEQRTEILKDLLDEFNVLEKDRNETLEGKQIVVDEKKESFLDLLTEEESLRLKDEAQNEIIAEYEADGVKDFQITDQEITERAISIFERQEADNTDPKKPVKAQLSNTQSEIEKINKEKQEELDSTISLDGIKTEQINKLDKDKEVIRLTEKFNETASGIERDDILNKIEVIEKRINKEVKDDVKKRGLKVITREARNKISQDARDKITALNNKSNQNPENNEESNEKSSQEANDEEINTEEEEEDANQEDVLEKDSVVEPKKKAPKPTTTKRVSPKGVKGDFDVEMDSGGNVVSIKSAKDGRSISKFYEKTSKKTGKKTLAKNANYSRIENEAVGQKTDNQINEANKKRTFEAIDSYTPTNEYEAALEYFANGGNIDLDSASKETGASKNELKWASGFKKKSKLPSVERASEQITDNSNLGLDQTVVRDAIIQILLENQSISDIQSQIVSLQEQIDANQDEQELSSFLGSLSQEELSLVESQMAEDSFLEELTYAQKVQYYEEQFGTTEEKAQFEIDRQRSIDGESEGSNTSIQEREGAQDQDVDDTIQEGNSDDAFLKGLEDAEKQLKDFGDGTLVINLPVAIAIKAIQVVKAAYKAGKKAALALEEGLNYIKSTDWYKSLTRKEKREITTDTIKQAISQSSESFKARESLQENSEAQAMGIGSKNSSKRDSSLGKGGPVKILNEVQQRTRRFWNQSFKTNAGTSKKIGNIVRSLGREMSSVTNALEHELGEINEILGSTSKSKNSKGFKERALALNDYLLGVEGVDISFLNKNQIDKIDQLRSRVDKLSTNLQEKLEEQKNGFKEKLEGLDKDSAAYSSISDAINRVETLQETIESNKGQYLYRSYDAFKNTDYLERLTSKNVNKEGNRRIDNAVQFLMDESSDLFGSNITEKDARKRVFEYLESLKTKKDLVLASAEGEKKAPFYKKKKEIPKAFRELLGESNDPLLNYASTVFKISNYIASTEYQNKMRIELLESGLGTYDAQAGFTKLTPDGEAWSGLSGLYVSKELYNSIQDLQPLSTINEDFYKAWVAFAAFTKLGKTALSPMTTMLNFISGSILALNAGFFFASDPKKIKDAMSMAWGTKKSRKELKSETDKLYKLGILGDGAISQEVMETINDFTNDIERISNQGAGKRVFNAIKKVYALGDDFYKVIGYYTYKGRYEKSGMTTLEAEAKAAQRIIDTFPTYSMLPKNIKRLRRFPLIGTFVSFPYLAVMTSANTFKYMKEDVKAGRSSMVAKQAAGFLIANASHLALAELSKNMMGFDDDDDDKVRDMLPFYQTNSKLIYAGKDKFGQPIFMDATALFPAEVYLKPLRTLFDDREGRDIQDNINEALKETLSPYLGFDISFKTMNELFFNRDVFDREIYEGENLIDGIFNDPDKVGQHYMKNAGPGFYGNITEFARANDVQPSFFGDKFTSYGKEYKNSDALMRLLGFRFTTLNYIAGTTSLGYRNKDKFDKKKDDITNAFKSTSRLDDSGMKESIEEYSKANKELSESMIIAVKGARKLGVNEADIFKALKQSAFSTEDVEFIMAGIQTPLKKITDISAISKLEKIDLNYRDKESKRKIKLNYLYNVTDFNVLVKQKNKETYKLMDKIKKDK